MHASSFHHISPLSIVPDSVEKEQERENQTTSCSPIPSTSSLATDLNLVEGFFTLCLSADADIETGMFKFHAHIFRFLSPKLTSKPACVNSCPLTLT